MAKEDLLFTQTADDDHIDEIDRLLAARRLTTYSPGALRVGVELDQLAVLHADFDSALKGLDRMFQLSKEFSMPQGGILVGNPGSGRRTLVSFFENTLPRSQLFAPGFGCVSLRISRAPSIGQLVQGLLRRYDYPFHKGTESRLSMRRNIAFDLVNAKGTRLISIFNAHHLMSPSGPSKSGHVQYDANVVDFICELQEVSKAAVLLCGNQRLDELIAAEPELKSRLSVRMELRQFKANASWLGLLRTISKDFKTMDITLIKDAAQAKRLHSLTQGNLRDLKRVLIEAVLLAAQGGAKAIAETHLQKAVEVIKGFAHQVTNPYVKQDTANPGPAKPLPEELEPEKPESSKE